MDQVVKPADILHVPGEPAVERMMPPRRARGDGWRLRRWVNTPERDGGPWVWKSIWEWKAYLVRETSQL